MHKGQRGLGLHTLDTHSNLEVFHDLRRGVDNKGKGDKEHPLLTNNGVTVSCLKRFLRTKIENDHN